VRYQTTRAVVLGSRPLGEADRIAVLFSRELGRVDAVVKGVRKTKSRWGGRLEPFNVCDLVLFHGRSSLFTVTSAQLIEMYLQMREDREALAAAGIACEAAAGLFAEGEPHERVFSLLRNALRAIDGGFTGPAMQAPLVLGVVVKLLNEAGYMPVLEHCASCGEGDLALAFSAARGGLVCENCIEDGVPTTPDAVEALRSSVSLPLAELRSAPSSIAVEEALRNIHNLYSYHTGGRLRSLRFARA
jgi:DNA repair protein RecO (recombination protein O)